MNTLAYHALSIGAAAALLAGCAAAQPPTGATPGGLTQSIHLATSSYEVLYRFDDHANGGEPLGRLLDVKGTLYGTASEGGTRQCSHGCGTVYSISPLGRVSLVFSFSAGDGAQPDTGLTDVKGTLYGTTPRGGASRRGTVYGITTAGVEALLYSFKGLSDGQHPQGRLINVNGTLFGTAGGGGGKCNCGVVYSLTTSGEEKVLYRFKSGPDGSSPKALVFINGMLYGTTTVGGAGTGCGNGTAGCGTFYSLSMSGKHKVLYSFGGGSDGAYPEGELISVSGTLYGLTGSGGSGLGTVYSITTSGAEQVVYRFVGGSDGADPVGGLLDLNGTLYGTTYSGGGTDCFPTTNLGCGTIYSVTTSGAESVLHRFAGGSDGNSPMTALTDLHGSLYGTASRGGNTKYLKRCCGTVFRFTP
ncbi:MAG TPA: choice-of-anchor tandem repeat GloVer-containing protein [Candidatus Binatia bacterium]|nr:choice-of-anchor tandem repeat GloVer-containing protein [Candidatus Binatia bacterium]